MRANAGDIVLALLVAALAFGCDGAGGPRRKGDAETRVAETPGQADGEADSRAGPDARTGGGEGVPKATEDVRYPSALGLDLGDDLAMELVYVKPGRFTMGSPEFDVRPAREVTIANGFHMGKYEVTQAQYERIMGTNPSKFKGASNPVEGVSWNDTAEFCRRLSERTGRTVRLPTEEEWEYACRAGSMGRYCFGDNEGMLGQYAWYRDNSDSTHPVGRKRANAFGLHDMHGNVMEWCNDWATFGVFAETPRKYRMVCGGSWGFLTESCRSYYRNSCPPSESEEGHVGFRVVVEAGKP